MFPILDKFPIRYLLLPFLGGLLYASGFPQKGDGTFFLGPFIGMALLLSTFGFESWNYKSLRLELTSVLAFSVGHYLLGYYWIPYTIQEFGRVPFPYNHSLGLFFSFVILPHFLVFVLGNAFFKKMKLQRAPWIDNPSRRHLFYALIFTVLEYWTPQQFPGHLGHPWLSLAPYLGLAPHFGAPVYSFFSYLIILAVLHLIRTKKLDGQALSYFIVFLVLNFAFPLSLQDDENTDTLNVRMVQANIGNYLKVSSETGNYQALNQVLDQFYEMSTAPSEKPLDLIIWPETAYPRLLSSQMMKTSSLYSPRLAKDTVQATQAELFFGGYDQIAHSGVPSDYFETEYNSAFLLDSEGQLKDVYHKRVLIPFGESLPFGPFNRFLSQYVQNISFFAKGERSTLFSTRNAIPFISVICYEVLFSSYLRNFLGGLERHPRFIINLTNDSWYGDTAEPYQHLFLAKWRALEFAIPILRMTNTGITSAIYPDGSESRRLLPFTKESLDLELKIPLRQSTYFERFGVWATIALALFLIGLNRLISQIHLWLRNPL